mmetsp:Transcript_38580/g.96621  ORF Transcript_38580/g.96621 Transcript_38580/m.96621 type:complete len:236 (+) Transcript_38580:1040-1747(+)
MANASVSSQCLSSPSQARYTALSSTFRPLKPSGGSYDRMSLSKTPVHSAKPTAPSVHWLPPTCGRYPARPWPAHWSGYLRVTVGKLLSCCRVKFLDPSTPIPSIVSVHPSESWSIARLGMSPLLRTKNLSIGVSASSSSHGGVSIFVGHDATGGAGRSDSFLPRLFKIVSERAASSPRLLSDGHLRSSEAVLPTNAVRPNDSHVSEAQVEEPREAPSRSANRSVVSSALCLSLNC